jgi:hypothetical protein
VTRALTGTVLAIATSWVLATPASAEVTRSTTGYASVFLTHETAGEVDVFVPFDVFAPEGIDAFGRGEVFVQGFECTTEDSVPATVDGLSSATAGGTLDLVCSSPEREVTGHAEIDLVWTADGPVERTTTAGRFSPCVTHLQVRHAAVTGSMTIVIPDLGVGVVVTPPGDDDDSIRQEHSLCHPSRG